jgi:hypothetical protein
MRSVSCADILTPSSLSSSSITSTAVSESPPGGHGESLVSSASSNSGYLRAIVRRRSRSCVERKMRAPQLGQGASPPCSEKSIAASAWHVTAALQSGQRVGEPSGVRLEIIGGKSNAVGRRPTTNAARRCPRPFPPLRLLEQATSPARSLPPWAFAIARRQSTIRRSAGSQNRPPGVVPYRANVRRHKTPRFAFVPPRAVF